MRTDHVAYRQATRVAGLGLLLQAVIGITMLVVGVVQRDTAMIWGASFLLTGCVVWLSLVVVFHQHTLERLEALESDELAAARGTSIFDGEADATRVALRRLSLMHAWLMPGVSLLVAVALAGLGLLLLRSLRDEASGEGDFVFRITGQPGWALAVALSLALISFIFSRFVAGMSKVPAWQNLRGGAGFMVGNAIVLLAFAVGYGFQFARKDAVLHAIVLGFAFFMVALSAEILLNFLLHLYRPRRPGETPRPAFDSRVLSLLAAPDSIVRSINEAVNYQFGFDITSSWGYQLLLRSFRWLVLVGVAAMVLLSCFVVVEPDQQAVRVRLGRIVAVEPPGLLLKLPWPIERVELHRVGRVRELVLGLNPQTQIRPGDETRVNFWVNEDPAAADRKLFFTGASRLGTAPAGARPVPMVPGEDEIEAQIGAQVSMVDAEIVVQWKIREDGLLDWLGFASDSVGRRGSLTARERAMRAVAMREMADYLSRLPLEDVLSPSRSGVLDALRQRIQARFDAIGEGIGVEVVAVTASLLRPPADAAPIFEEFSISVEAKRQAIDIAQKSADVTMAMLVAGRENAERIVGRIDALGALPEAERLAGRREIEQMIVDSRGQAAATIESAEARRWRTQMQARADRNRLLGDLPMFEAAPELYRQRRIMNVLARALPGARVKYLLGVPADRVRLEVEMLEPDSGLNFLETIERNRQESAQP